MLFEQKIQFIMINGVYSNVFDLYYYIWEPHFVLYSYYKNVLTYPIKQVNRYTHVVKT